MSSALISARAKPRALSRSRGGKGGSVVLVSSAATRLGSPGEYVDYAGSKAALDTLAIGLAKELGSEGVRVNAVRPGLIETEIHATTGDPDRARKRVPHGCAPTPKHETVRPRDRHTEVPRRRRWRGLGQKTVLFARGALGRAGARMQRFILGGR